MCFFSLHIFLWLVTVSVLSLAEGLRYAELSLQTPCSAGFRSQATFISRDGTVEYELKMEERNGIFLIFLGREPCEHKSVRLYVAKGIFDFSYLGFNKNGRKECVLH